MSFEREVLQWAIPVVAVGLTVLFALDVTRRRRQLERIGDPATVARMMASLSRRRRVAKAVMWVVALILCVAALAQPTVPGEKTWRQRGIDIALALDFSKSMLAEDVYPSRLERSVREAEALTEELAADRISTVVFAGAAVHFPLTHDHRAARLLHTGLTPGDLAPGSNLGEAFLVARCVLRPDVLDDGACGRIGGRGLGGAPLTGGADDALRAESPAVADRARAIVMFTDGEDSDGTARAEVTEAVRLGIEVYLVGVGTTAGELIPELDDRGERIGWKQGPDGAFVRTRLDRAGLLELAEIAGGADHYFDLGPEGFSAERDRLLAELAHLEKGDLDERVVWQPHHVFQRFLFPAFLLLILEACLGDRRRTARRTGAGVVG